MVVVVIVQSQAATEPAAAAGATAAAQIGATATIHTVKILAEDGVLLMHILPILGQAAVPAHTGLQILDGALAAAMALVALL